MRSTRELVVLMTAFTVSAFIATATIVVSFAALSGAEMEQPWRALIALVGTLAAAVAGYIVGSRGMPPGSKDGNGQ